MTVSNRSYIRRKSKKYRTGFHCLPPHRLTDETCHRAERIVMPHMLQMAMFCVVVSEIRKTYDKKAGLRFSIAAWVCIAIQIAEILYKAMP